jgi:hypothetical protein
MTRNLAAAALVAALVATPVAFAHGDDDAAKHNRPGAQTLAVIGDIPYGAAQIAAFPAEIGQINADPAVRRVIHLGDVTWAFAALGIFGLLPLGPGAPAGATLAAFGAADVGGAVAAGLMLGASAIIAVVLYALCVAMAARLQTWMRERPLARAPLAPYLPHR